MTFSVYVLILRIHLQGVLESALFILFAFIYLNIALINKNLPMKYCFNWSLSK